MNEAELLFTEILDCNRADLYLNSNLCLAKNKKAKISSVLKRRIQAEPIDYILGKTEFMGLEFRLNRNVFIPRPETEILVETAVKIASQYPSTPASRLNVLDIGTGSGCIAVSLAKFIRNINVTASDISNEALETAKCSALLNNVEVNFLQSDLFSNYGLRTTDYGLIMSNPPYIPTAQIDNLAPEISYEPAIALDGGRDGMDFYRRIIDEAPAYLKKGGFLILEMGFGQAQDIKNIFNSCGNFKIIEVVRDYSNIERVIVARKTQNSKGKT